MRAEGSGGARILLGASGSIGALLEALDGISAPRPVAEEGAESIRPTSVLPAAPAEPPARSPTPTALRVFERYFSSSQPTPSPTPR